MADRVLTAASFSLSSFSTFPHSHHAVNELGDPFFARLELGDGSIGTNTECTVFAWMGMGMSFLFGSSWISGPDGGGKTGRKDLE